MCGLKEIFEGAGNFFDKKVPAISTFLLRENSLYILLFRLYIKQNFPHPSLRDTFSTGEKALKPFRQTFGLPPYLSGTAFELGRLP